MSFDARLRTMVACVVVATVPVAMAEREHAPVFACGVCPDYYNTRAELNKHGIVAHGKTGCLGHGVLFKGKLEVNRHAVLPHGRRDCLQCGLHFHDSAGAREHFLKKHPVRTPKGVKTSSAARSAGSPEPPPGKARKAPAEKVGEGPSPK